MWHRLASSNWRIEVDRYVSTMIYKEVLESFSLCWQLVSWDLAEHIIHLKLHWPLWFIWELTDDFVCSLVSDIGSSPFVRIRLGDGLSTGWKEKLGESALDRDSGVPTELMVPGSGLAIASNLKIKLFKHS